MGTQQAQGLISYCSFPCLLTPSSHRCSCLGADCGCRQCVSLCTRECKAEQREGALPLYGVMLQCFKGWGRRQADMQQQVCTVSGRDGHALTTSILSNPNKVSSTTIIHGGIQPIVSPSPSQSWKSSGTKGHQALPHKHSAGTRGRQSMHTRMASHPPLPQACPLPAAPWPPPGQPRCSHGIEQPPHPAPVLLLSHPPERSFKVGKDEFEVYARGLRDGGEPAAGSLRHPGCDHQRRAVHKTRIRRALKS